MPPPTPTKVNPMGLLWQAVRREVALPKLGDICLGQTIDFAKFIKGHEIAYTGIVTEIKANLMETLAAWRHKNSNGQFWFDIRITFTETGTGKVFMIMLGHKIQIDQKTQKFRCWFGPQGTSYEHEKQYRLSDTMIHDTYNKTKHTLREIVTTDLFTRWDAIEKMDIKE